MTKKEMLLKICGCTQCKANKECVEAWYKEYLRVQKEPTIVKDISSWKRYAAYMLGAI